MREWLVNYDSFEADLPEPMHIEIDDLTRRVVHQLLHEHLANMYEITPADKVFALDLSKLRSPDITFWTVWEADALLGCGALKELTPSHGEVKSMRTSVSARRRGAGRAVLMEIVRTARQRGYEALSLETGSHPAFLPAQQLYRSLGFEYTGPFADYQEDPHSVFMRLALREPADIGR
jgi:putative acetyltransferase